MVGCLSDTIVFCFCLYYVNKNHHHATCHYLFFFFFLFVTCFLGWNSVWHQDLTSTKWEKYIERELGRERQKVFFSFACYLNTVCIHFFLRVAFVYMNKSLEDARQLTATFTHFRIAAYTSSRARKLMAMLGCSLLNSFLSFPTR